MRKQLLLLYSSLLVHLALCSGGYNTSSPLSTICINEPLHHFLNISTTLQHMGATIVSTKWISKYAIINEVLLPNNKTAIAKIQLLRARTNEGWEVKVGRKLKAVQSVPMSQWEYEQRQHRKISHRIPGKTLRVPHHYVANIESFFICGNYSRKYDFGVSVMEHMSTLDLWDYVLDEHRNDTLSDLEKYAQKAADALHTLHILGIHHGDYHSKNVMILNQSIYEVGVIDFSFSHIHDTAFAMPCKDVYDDVLDFVYDMYHLNTTRTMHMLDAFRRVVCDEIVHICKDWFNVSGIQELRGKYEYDFCELKLLEFYN